MASLRSRKAHPAATPSRPAASAFDDSAVPAQPRSPSPFTPISPKVLGAIPADYIHPVEEEEDKGFCEEVLLTVAQAARIVGRGGATINQIKLQSKAYLGLVTQKKTATHVPLEIPSHFLHQFERAKTMVEEKLREMEMSSDGGSHAYVSTFDSNGFGQRLGGGTTPPHPLLASPYYLPAPTGFGFKPPTPTPTRERTQPSPKQVEPRPAVAAASVAGPTMDVPKVLDKMEVAAENVPYLDTELLGKVRKAFGVKLVLSQANASAGTPSTLYINGPTDKVEAARRQLEKFLRCGDDEEESAGDGADGPLTESSAESQPISSVPSHRAFSVANPSPPSSPLQCEASSTHLDTSAGTDLDEEDSSECDSEAGTGSVTVRAADVAAGKEESTPTQTSSDLEAAIEPSVRPLGPTGYSTPLDDENASTESKSVDSTEAVASAPLVAEDESGPPPTDGPNPAFEKIREILIGALSDAVIGEVHSAVTLASEPKNVPKCEECGTRTRDTLFECAHFTHCHECAESLAECPRCGETVTTEATRLF